MPLRLLARELYEAIRRVDEVQKRLASAPLAEQAEWLDVLRRAKAERDRLRRMLDGQKDRC